MGLRPPSADASRSGDPDPEEARWLDAAHLAAAPEESDSEAGKPTPGGVAPAGSGLRGVSARKSRPNAASPELIPNGAMRTPILHFVAAACIALVAAGAFAVTLYMALV